MSNENKPKDGQAQPDAGATAPPPLPPQPQPIVQQVQYVKTEKSLEGLSGWLMFFLICFVISGLSMFSALIYNFFTPVNSGSTLVLSIFAPLLFASAIVSAVFIVLRLKVARITAIATYGLAATEAITASLVVAAEEKLAGAGWAAIIVGSVFSIVIFGLFSLYFVVSRRVKATLTNSIPKVVGIAVLSSAGGLAAILLILGVILTLSADKSRSNTNKVSDTPTYNQYDDEQNSNEAAELKEVKLDQTINDSEIGYVIKLKRVIWNIPFDSSYYNSYTSVAVEVEVQNNSQYDETFYTNDLKFNVGGEDQYSSNYNIKNYVNKQGMNSLPSTVAQGKTATGWVYAVYEETSSDVLLVYNRDSVTVYDSSWNSSVVPSKYQEIKLSADSASKV